MPHVVNWFEIPAADLNRAKQFYEAIFMIKMVVPPGPMKTAFFPADWRQGDIGGSIVEGEGYVPASVGTLVFLSAGKDLSEVLGRVEAAGGRVQMPKTQVPMEDSGYIATFLDTEGNKVGICSPK